MKTRIKIIFLKWIIQFVYLLTEHTPPEVKSSIQNYKVAKAGIALEELLQFLEAKKTRNL